MTIMQENQKTTRYDIVKPLTAIAEKLKPKAQPWLKNTKISEETPLLRGAQLTLDDNDINIIHQVQQNITEKFQKVSETLEQQGNKIKKLEEDIENMKTEHSSEILRIETKHDLQIKSIETKHDLQIKSIETKHDSQTTLLLESIQNKVDNAVKKAMEKPVAEIAALKKENKVIRKENKEQAKKIEQLENKATQTTPRFF